MRGKIEFEFEFLREKNVQKNWYLNLNFCALGMRAGYFFVVYARWVCALRIFCRICALGMRAGYFLSYMRAGYARWVFFCRICALGMHAGYFVSCFVIFCHFTIPSKTARKNEI